MLAKDYRLFRAMQAISGHFRVAGPFREAPTTRHFSLFIFAAPVLFQEHILMPPLLGAAYIEPFKASSTYIFYATRCESDSKDTIEDGASCDMV